MSKKHRFYRAIIIVLSIALIQLFIFTRITSFSLIPILVGLFIALLTTALLLYVFIQSIKAIQVISKRVDQLIVVSLGVIINAVVLYLMFVLTFNYMRLFFQVF